MIAKNVFLMVLIVCLFGNQVQAAEFINVVTDKAKMLGTSFGQNIGYLPMPTVADKPNVQKQLNTYSDTLKKDFRNLKAEMDANAKASLPTIQRNIMRTVENLKTSGIIPQKSTNRFKLLELISVASDPAHYKVITKEGTKTLFDAIDLIKRFTEPEDLAFAGVEGAPVDITTSAQLVDETKKDVETALKNFEGLLYKPMLQETQQRVKAIQSWQNAENAQNMALLLLAAYDLERGFYEAYNPATGEDNRSNVFGASKPIFDALSERKLELPHKTINSATKLTHYKLGKYSETTNDVIRGYAEAGEGDVLKGFCIAIKKAPWLQDEIYNQLCALVPTIVLKKENEANKKAVTEDIVPVTSDQKGIDELAVNSFQRELHGSTLPEMEQRINAIKQWQKAEDVQKMALLLLMASELQKGTDLSSNTLLPLLQEFKQRELSVPVKRVNDITGIPSYRLGSYGTLTGDAIMQYEKDGDGDVLKGICMQQESPSALNPNLYKQMCILVKATFGKKQEEIQGKPQIKTVAYGNQDQSKRPTPQREKLKTESNPALLTVVKYDDLTPIDTSKPSPNISSTTIPLSPQQIAALMPHSPTSYVPAPSSVQPVPTGEGLKSSDTTIGASSLTIVTDVPAPKSKTTDPSPDAFAKIRKTLPEATGESKQTPEKVEPVTDVEKKKKEDEKKSITPAITPVPQVQTQPQVPAPQPRGFFYTMFSSIGTGFGYIAKPFVGFFKSVGSFFSRFAFWR